MTHRLAVVLLVPLFLSMLPARSPAQVPPDWENPAVFERNQTAAHATLMPFATVGEARANARKASPFCLLLSGTWKFRWAENPDRAPAGFQDPSYDVSGWDEIRVPGNWQMEGFGQPMFRNIAHPFPATPPTVPKGYNPVGSYRRTFEVPEAWAGRQVFLHFEGVKSASRVWVNGREVGYNQGGMEPAEYDVTGVLQPGENTLAVWVLRYSDGTYLEDQDMWRLSGIFRDVYLMATPKVHVRDFAVTTDLDADYRDAELSVQAELANYGDALATGRRLRATLFDGEKPVLAAPLVATVPDLKPGTSQPVRLCSPVGKPRLWSAEHPNLYTLTLELLDRDGSTSEVLSCRVGFREIEVKDQALLVNGQPVKLNGVNSHVQHPDTGRTMDTETMRRDLVLMKRFNVNTVRTSHYPPNVEYLDLADELGLYVIDEAGDEAHATEFLSERPEWRAAYVDRGRKMVLRDRNHPSIIIWSAGNESGSGDNICAVIAEGKRLDPSRPAWLYGGNNDYFPANRPLDCEDIVGPRYPTPFELRTRVALLPADQAPRPSFMDEYAAATGNSLGALDEYWDVIWNHPRTIGGAVWDWVSPGLRSKWMETEDASPHHNHGALMERATLVPGHRGQAVALSGHDQWVEVYRDPSLDLEGDQLTLSAWVLPRAWNGTGPIVTKGEQLGLRQAAADQLELYIHDRRRVSVTARIPEGWEGAWHQVAGVYDGHELRLLVDGSVLASTPHSGTIDAGAFPVNVGRNAELHGQEHPGELLSAVVDQVRVFARALSRDELDQDTPELRQEARLWLDFDRAEEKGEFYSLGIGGRSYGVVWPDRTPQPELWQLKKSAQPVKVEAVDLAKGWVRIQNRHSFTDLSELETEWRVLEDAEVQQSGHLELKLPPLQERLLQVPFTLPEPKPGAEHRLEISFRLPRERPWAPAGHEVAFEQLELPVEVPLRPPLEAGSMPPLRLSDLPDRLLVAGQGFEYAFSKAEGTLSSLRIQGVELLERGPRANVFRAPLANERDAWGLFRGRLSTHREGMGNDIANGWRAVGLDRLTHHVEGFHARQRSQAEVVVEVRSHASFDQAKGMAFASAFDLAYTYRILGSGDILLEVQITPQDRMPDWLPKAGLQMALRPGFSRLSWYGRGPYENYPDRKTGARIGVYERSVAEEYTPYLVPQDYGNKCDVRWAALVNPAGIGLFVAGAEPLDLSAQIHDTDNLARAVYPFQLRPTGAVTLNLDHAVSGVGGTAISVLDKYRVFPGPYRYTVRLRPFQASREGPRSLYAQGMPR